MFSVLVTATQRLGRVGRAARDDGPAAAARLGARMAAGAARRAVAGAAEVLTDWRLGARTRGIVRNHESLRTVSLEVDGHYYEPVRVRNFRSLLSAVDLDPAAGTFVDLGAGRGRALLLAANAGFRSVIGIELDAGLAAQGRRNLARWAARHGGRAAGRTFSVVQQDAGKVTIPDGPVVIFLYNPFGPATLRRVLDRVVESHRVAPRPIRVCYVNPVHAGVLDAHPGLVCRARSEHWVVYRVEAPRTAAGQSSGEM
jgi:hypothetical protein